MMYKGSSYRSIATATTGRLQLCAEKLQETIAERVPAHESYWGASHALVVANFVEDDVNVRFPQTGAVHDAGALAQRRKHAGRHGDAGAARPVRRELADAACGRESVTSRYVQPVLVARIPRLRRVVRVAVQLQARPLTAGRVAQVVQAAAQHVEGATQVRVRLVAAVQQLAGVPGKGAAEEKGCRLHAQGSAQGSAVQPASAQRDPKGT